MRGYSSGVLDIGFDRPIELAPVILVGVTACIAFWRDLNFKATAVSAASIFLLGDAVGHVKQMLIAGNFAPGNAGIPFYVDIICPVLAIAKRQSAVQKS